MSDAMEEHDENVSIGSRNITNLRFADDIYALAEEEQELEALVESLDKTCRRYKMEVSAEKTKLMTNSANGLKREKQVNWQKLSTVTSFKYLGAVVSDYGSKLEVLSRIAQATAALTKLKPIWRDNNISLGSKVELMRSFVISIFLYACESWKSRKENPQKLTQLSSRSHPRHLVGKRTAQKDTIIDITSDSQGNSNFPYRWSPASLTFHNYFYLFLYLYIT